MWALPMLVITTTWVSARRESARFHRARACHLQAPRRECSAPSSQQGGRHSHHCSRLPRWPHRPKWFQGSRNSSRCGFAGRNRSPPARGWPDSRRQRQGQLLVRPPGCRQRPSQPVRRQLFWSGAAPPGRPGPKPLRLDQEKVWPSSDPHQGNKAMADCQVLRLRCQTGPQARLRGGAAPRDRSTQRLSTHLAASIRSFRCFEHESMPWSHKAVRRAGFAPWVRQVSSLS